MNTIMAGMISLFLMQTPGSMTVPAPTALTDVNYSLTNRYTNTFVNDVFTDNILLTLAYMQGVVKAGEAVNWDIVRSDFTYRLVLNPGETFAFHDRVLPEYEGKIAMTTNSHFNSQEGFRSDHYLVGDGVCHLASFMNVAALQAGLTVVAPTRHDFAKIEEVPKQFGVAIYYDPTALGSSRLQNLYITNNRKETVEFVFRHKNKALEITVLQDGESAPLQSLISPLS